jgi:hypothetical protein
MRLPFFWASEAILGRPPIPHIDNAEMAVCKWLQTQKPDFYHGGIFKLMPRREKCINALGNSAEK